MAQGLMLENPVADLLQSHVLVLLLVLVVKFVRLAKLVKLEIQRVNRVRYSLEMSISEAQRTVSSIR